MKRTNMQAAFTEAHSWRPAPAAEAAEERAPDAVGLAMDLLHQIASDGLLRPSQRVAARRAIRRLTEAG